MTQDESLLSKFYGVFTIRIENMEDINCFIMDNLLGRDFNNILRIYDLKGSSKGRKVPLSKKQLTENSSGMQVLKDLNFIEFSEAIDIQPQ